MCREKEDAGINQDRQRPVKERRAGQGHSGADIHRVTHETIRPANHEFSWRIERRGRAFPDEHKREHAPKRNRRADRYYDRPGDLRRSGSCGRNNAGPRQEPGWQINQHEPNKKRRVSNCTNQDKHIRDARLRKHAAD